jgi:hypothetical protein
MELRIVDGDLLDQDVEVIVNAWKTNCIITSLMESRASFVFAAEWPPTRRCGGAASRSAYCQTAMASVEYVVVQPLPFGTEQ